MNLIGWILVAVGAVGLLTSIAGILHVFLQPTAAELLANLKSDLYLHDTYYVMASRTVYSLLLLLLCASLSVAISIVGYMHTEHFIRRMIPTEGSSENWQSPPPDA